MPYYKTINEKVLEMRCLLDEVGEKGEPLLNGQERDFLERMAILIEEYVDVAGDMTILATSAQAKWVDSLYEKYYDYIS